MDNIIFSHEGRRLPAIKVEKDTAALDYTDRLRWKALQNGRIYVSNELGDESAENIDLEIQEAIRNGIKDLQIVITTPGGDVFAGLAIYDELSKFKADGGRITTIAKGYAASMGAIILQAGNIRIAYKNAKILIHEVSQFSFFEHSTSSEANEKAEELKKVNEQLARILAERSGLSIQKIKALIKKRDYWMTAQEALKLNFVDKVV